ncbi:M48 family metalloprotease [Streptomyces abikoensis]|uniref:M48 family metalloprotease n=1 Tax=Streptomyces TaxID=1883 RepID=UPI0033C7F8E8
MTWAVWAPLIIPFLAVPAARRLAAALPPRPAALLLVAAAVTLACLSGAALALLAGAAVLRLPVVASLGHLSVPLLERIAPAAVPVGVVAAVAAGAVAVAVARVLHGHRAARARVSRELAGHSRAGDLTVLPDEGADAYALPGRPGGVVVTAGMLRGLDADERAVLLAHERAHLTGRHHLLLLLARLAACAHPALRGLREPLAFQVERWADEAAAVAVGDRRLAARAVARAALAASAAPAGRVRPAGALPAAAGPVPRRVAALLSAPPVARGAFARARSVSAVLLACLLVSGAAAAEATTDLHEDIETAQAGSAAPPGP